MKKILLTSFETWLPHQKSNSSDDLLHHIESERIDGVSLTFVRKLPVDTVLASPREAPRSICTQMSVGMRAGQLRGSIPRKLTNDLILGHFALQYIA